MHIGHLVSEVITSEVELREIENDETLEVPLAVHPVHLARVFRSRFQCSPIEYLRQCRVSRSMRLLATTCLPICQVALECGFYDQSHLTRSFLRVTGTTPGRFRSTMAQ